MSNRLLMIDVSSNQGAVDVAALHRAGYRAIGVKATQGTDYTNPFYARTVTAAHRLGMHVVHYHWLVADKLGVDQADHFLHVVRPHLHSRRDQLACDIEPQPSGYSQWGRDKARLLTQTFQHRIWDEAPRIGLLHRRPRRLDYGPPYFLRDEHIRPVHGEGLWIASYGGSHPVFIPPGWRRWRIWQFTASAHVPGVSGEVDESHIRPGVLRRLFGYPTLAFGDRGEAVRLLQHLLNERVEGERLHVTGQFDTATKVRVNDVHRILGNRRTGIVGRRVWRWLLHVPKAAK